MKEHQRAWRTSFRTPQHGAFNRYSIPILPIAALLILLTSAVAARAEELLLPLLRSQMGEEASAQKQVVEELRRLPTTQSLELVRINTQCTACGLYPAFYTEPLHNYALQELRQRHRPH